ncbi:MAG: hypothetical protein EP323_02565 [Gammaproteobacteria bacterium]|nr:MAG: hypothetical protein EP323_02565 [Gammaproteobacteria bacterium]
MSSKEKKFNIPVSLILLDMFGAVLAAIGILGLMEEGALGDYLLLAGGILLMMPLVLHILNRMRDR